jgi:hypothetical protein
MRKKRKFVAGCFAAHLRCVQYLPSPLRSRTFYIGQVSLYRKGSAHTWRPCWGTTLTMS